MAKTKKTKPAHEGRDVVYDKTEVNTHTEDGDGLFDVELAKHLLGWTTEAEGEGYGDDYFLKDAEGRKVRLQNNINNRPWYGSNSMALMHEMLHGRWEFNGEPIVITRTGLVANGQHQMIGLVWAQQEVDAHPKQWKKYHPDGQVRIPKLVVLGISDEERVINTLDTGKPRTLADVLFRSHHFATLPPGDRKALARLADGAVRVVWERTGSYKGSDAYSPRRTHGEMLDFIARHPRLVDAVEEVWRINEGGSMGQVVRPGVAAGLLYLMAAGKTEQEEYAKKRRESAVDFGLWAKAVQYLTSVADDAKEVHAVRVGIGNLADSSTGEGATAAERVAVLVLGWHDWRTNGVVGNASVKFNRDDYEPPLAGGIDQGPKTDEPPPTDEEEDDDPTEVSAEEAEAMGRDDYEPTERTEGRLAEASAAVEGPGEEVPVKPTKPKNGKKPKPVPAEAGE